MKPWDMAAAVLVIALWAGNFTATRLGVGEVPPFMLLTIRFFITASVLIWFFPRPSWAQAKVVMQLSITLGVLHFGLIFAGIQYIDASTTTLVLQMEVPFSILVGYLVLKEKVGLAQILGVVVAMFGVGIIAGQPHVLDNLLGFFLIVASAFFWAVANLQMKKLAGLNSFSLNAWMALFGTFNVALLSFIFEDNQLAIFEAMTTSAWMSVMYMVICSTIMGYGLWFWLLARYPISAVVPFSLLLPLFGVMFGITLLDEPFSMTIIYGGAAIIAGLGIIMIKPSLRKPQKTLEQ